MEALLATYVDEEADESRGDLADAFARCWRQRLQVLLLGKDNVVDDTQDGMHEGELEGTMTMKELARKRRARTKKEKGAAGSEG